MKTAWFHCHKLPRLSGDNTKHRLEAVFQRDEKPDFLSYFKACHTVPGFSKIKPTDMP